MTKMDMVWIATANLLHPNTASASTVTRDQIESEVNRLFGGNVEIPRVLIDRHLVSFERRQANRAIPERGGSRNRYLFRTADGRAPSRQGRFRLYKSSDAAHDGEDKTGPTHPDPANVDAPHHHLISWYEDVYFRAP
jgi:hypothetical protein